MRKSHIIVIALFAMVLSVACQAETENSTKIENKKKSVPIKQQSQQLSLAELKKMAMIQLEEGDDESRHMLNYIKALAGNELTNEETLKYFDEEIFPKAEKNRLYGSSLTILNHLMNNFFFEGNVEQAYKLDKRIEAYLKDNASSTGTMDRNTALALSYVMARTFRIYEQSFQGEMKRYAQIRQYIYHALGYRNAAWARHTNMMYNNLYLAGLVSIKANNKRRLQEAYDELVLLNKDGFVDKEKGRFQRLMKNFEAALTEMERAGVEEINQW